MVNRLFSHAVSRFRWAACQLDSLANCRHEAAVQEALASLPRNLNDTYRRMLASIPVELKDDATRLLQFLVHNERPLRLSEAIEVVATQISGKSVGFDVRRRLYCDTGILDYCPGLVTIVPDALGVKELHLAHFSVKQYLLSHIQFDVAIASTSIARTCLTYLADIGDVLAATNVYFPMTQADLSMGGFESPLSMARFYLPMAQLAARIWMDFAVLAESSEDVAQEIVAFLQDEAAFQRWYQLYEPYREYDEDPGFPPALPLYLMCLGGLSQTAKLLVLKGADIDADVGFYGNALQAASWKGHTDIVQFLSERADVNAQGGFYGNALQAASSRGHLKIVELLLEKGAKINAEDDTFGNAVQVASWEGHVKVVELLLSRGADADALGGIYCSALHAASSRGHTDIVKLLVDNKVDVNLTDRLGRTPLFLASRAGHDKAVRLLIADDRTDHALEDWYGSTAIFAAVRNGHYEVTRTLLSSEKSMVGGRDGFGRDLTWWARHAGHARNLRLLLAHVAKTGVMVSTAGIVRPRIRAITASFPECLAWCDACTMRMLIETSCRHRSPAGEWLRLCDECCRLLGGKSRPMICSILR